MTPDHRRSQRLTCALPSSFVVVDHSDGSPSSFAVVEDFSMEGLKLRSHDWIPLNRLLRLFLYLEKHRAIEVMIRPAWIALAHHEGLYGAKYRTGARFVELDESAQNALRRYSEAQAIHA